ncbi:heterokaryon incompatibility protein [Hirsutella rhossiliensis]
MHRGETTIHNLCDPCRLGATSRAAKLGFLHDIHRKSSHCAFCHLVIQAVCTKRIRTSITPQALIHMDRVKKRPAEYYIYSYCFARPYIPSEGRKEAYRIGISCRTTDPGRRLDPDNHLGDMQLLRDDALALYGSKCFYGRLLEPKRISTSLPKSWLRFCQHNHGRICEEPSGSDRHRPGQLLVIDVSHSSYLALSYFDEAKYQPTFATLPRVVQDAIDFVAELGECYLWVDALCILFQQSQMDKIYGSATLTIVSAAATMDAQKISVGLPRFNENVKCRPQKAALVRNRRFIVPFESIMSLLDHSRWNTRGWTYQELLLSRRLLFFTDSQVYFQCSESVFSEDGIGETSFRTEFITPVSNLWNPGGPSEGGLQLGSLHLKLQEFAAHVEVYSRRNLSFASDILKAFRGIQNILSESMETDFWFGMPERFLDSALLWISDLQQMRSTQGRFFIPSWSWAAWDNDVDVTWFLVNEKMEAIIMESQDVDQGSQGVDRSAINRHPHMLPPSIKNVLTMPRPEMPTISSLLDNAGKLSVDRVYCFVEWTWDDLARWRKLGHIELQRTVDWVIMMDRRWVRSALLQFPIFPFILMSRSDGLSLLSYPEVKFFDDEVFCPRPWCYMNVIRMVNGRLDKTPNFPGIM